MPAYRSSAEGEIREAVVARLRERRPDARIIHEINVSTYGPNRIDVLAVSPTEIIAVEVKSSKDKLDRLPAQVGAMRGCAHQVIAALHEKFLVEKPTNRGAAHYKRDGLFYLRSTPDLDCRPDSVWVFPEIKRNMHEDGWCHLAPWQLATAKFDAPLPAGAIDLLWRDELAWLCGSLGVAASRRTNMGEMVSALRWNCTGREITKGICTALRRRICTEADPAIEEAA
ncbi:NERD domain-containing protein [Devosia ginsengisoli]|uniref:NERD domain-containing protein n=1 Tax=Devosia ginsengisoli TaxID=400770 RepID=A0A5B8LSB1_9HYPH|nr:NERD domain-containing protein [Devosia ginsengisoli]QDZ10544.1 NERD domain-containing protein [Devosia ginsengisoli]